MTKLGNYQVVKCIGTTELTMLYLAKHPYLGKNLIIEASATKDDSVENRLKFLARLLGKLQHPNILPIVDAFEDGKTMYLVFDWPKDDLLSLDRIQKEKKARGHNEKFSLDEVLRYTLDLCEVLEYLQQNKVVHQNIKLDNIIVGSNKFYLGGFNLANTLEDSFAGERLPLDDARFASPEWVMRSPLNLKQDIWSVGVCIYKMLTNKYPFQGDGQGKTYAQALMEDPLVPLSDCAPDIPKSICDIVSKMLERNPEKRPELSEVIKVLSDQLYQVPIASAFIAMPFHPQFNRVYGSIKNVCQKCRIKPVRVDENLMPSNIWQEIEEGIKNALFVIGDISPVPGFEQTNPNVSFEVGIAYNLNKPTILLTQDIEKLPFDFKQQRVHNYINDTEELEKLEKTLEKIVNEIIAKDSSL